VRHRYADGMRFVEGRTILTGDGVACSFLAATAAGGGGVGAAGCRPLVREDAFFLSLSLSFFWRRNGKFFMVTLS
jgi:hypothetical protein